MTQAKIVKLEDRGVVSVTGPDAVKFLQGLITNDVEHLNAAPEKMAFAAEAVHAGLLSPQGKILFEFFCLRTPDGFVLDVLREKAADLVKRLTMYKLRAAVEIKDVSDGYTCLALWGPALWGPALWGPDVVSNGSTKNTIAFRDPRHPDLGRRILAEAHFAADIASAANGSVGPPRMYHAHRIALGVPEGGKDYDFAGAYPHEADFDLFAGVSFTKGCYVGQEIVARMQHKTAVRKRVVKISSKAPLPLGRPEVFAGDVPIGRLGSIDGMHGLAMLRLDRAEEAKAKGTPLAAAGIELEYSLPAGLPNPVAAS